MQRPTFTLAIKPKRKPARKPPVATSLAVPPRFAHPVANSSREIPGIINRSG